MVNTSKIPQAYSEVYEFMNALGEEYINKIPKKIYNVIKDNRDISYNPKFYDKEIITLENISKEGLAIIAVLNLQYWCEDQEEKERLKQVYFKNYENEKEKYSYDNIFKETKTKIEDTTKIESTEMIEYKKENILVKIINKIKRIFKN